LWRNETARVHGYPPANLLDNRQLKEIVEMNPKSIHQLTKIYGIGTYKASTYGREIIELLSVLDTHVDIVEVSSTPEDTKVVLHPVVDMVEDTEQSDVDHTNMITTGNKHG
jgi:ribonuclease D